MFIIKAFSLFRSLWDRCNSRMSLTIRTCSCHSSGRTFESSNSNSFVLRVLSGHFPFVWENFKETPFLFYNIISEATFSYFVNGIFLSLTLTVRWDRRIVCQEDNFQEHLRSTILRISSFSLWEFRDNYPPSSEHSKGTLLLFGEQEHLHVVLPLHKDVPALLKLKPLKLEDVNLLTNYIWIKGCSPIIK